MIQPVALAAVPKSPHGSFPSVCGLPQEASVPASGGERRGRRLDEPGRHEVHTVLGDRVHVGVIPLAMSSRPWSGWKLSHDEADHVKLSQPASQGRPRRDCPAPAARTGSVAQATGTHGVSRRRPSSVRSARERRHFRRRRAATGLCGATARLPRCCLSNSVCTGCRVGKLITALFGGGRPAPWLPARHRFRWQEGSALGC